MSNNRDNTNSGAIFVNKKKESDRHPDRTGTLNVEGREYWISGWINKSRSGETYMSLRVNPKDGQPQAPAPSTDFNEDDDIPF